MSRLRKTGLTIDDPLAPAAAQAAAPHATRPTRGVRSDSSARRPAADVASASEAAGDGRDVGEEAAGRADQDSAVAVAAHGALERSPSERSPRAQATRQPDSDAWRSWRGGTRVASYRLPDELLAELASTSAELQLQVGLIVTAAIAHLLDEPDDVIAALVDRADDARIQGRRATRRGLGTTPRSRSASGASATL